MATPTGQIALSDCNTEIMQRGAGNYIELTEPSNRLGYSGQRDMAQLRKAWGVTVSDRTYTSKFGTQYGYSYGIFGALNDYTISGGVYCNGIFTELFIIGSAQTQITNALGAFNPVGGWQGFDVERMAFGNVNAGITNRQNYYFTWNYFGTPLNGAGEDAAGIKFYA